MHNWKGREENREIQSEMADYHFVYKDVEGASTQWDDIQRKLGNLPPKPLPFKPPPFTPAEDEDSKPKDKAWIDKKSALELEEIEDDLDDDPFLQEYRSLFTFDRNQNPVFILLALIATRQIKIKAINFFIRSTFDLIMELQRVGNAQLPIWFWEC